MIRLYKFIGALLLTAGFFSLHYTDAYSQSEENLQVAVSNGDVYLYIVESPRADHAFNYYRQDPGSAEFVLLNDEPVRGVDFGDQLRSALGNRFDDLMRFTESTSAGSLLSYLRGNSTEAVIFSLAYPELAQAVNKLYIDRTAPEGETVIYRVEVLNQRDEPTGQVYEKEVTVEDDLLGETEILEVSNRGSIVTVEWKYTPVSESDRAFRFNIFTKSQNEDEWNRVNPNIILRNLEQETFSHSFEVISLDQEIEIRVGSVSVTAAPGPLSEPESILVEDNIPPSIVQNVRTALAADSVQIQWRVSRELDAIGYNIYRGTESDGDFNQINTELIPVQQPFYFDSDVIPGRRYLYKVSAVDDAGNESELSIPVPRLVPDRVPPPTPEQLTAEFRDGENEIHLNWQMSETPEDFRNFVVLRRIVEGRSPSNAYSQVAPPDLRENDFTDRSEFEEGALYRFGIIAADSSRNFSDTTFVDVRIPNVTPPDPPNVVRAQNRDGIRINVSWSGSLSRDVARYNLYKRSIDDEFQQTAELTSDLRTYRDEQISVGDTYVYAISAVDSSGNESSMVESDPVVVRRANPPRRVRNVRAVSVDGEIRVRWEPVSSEYLEGYRVYAADRSTGNYQPLNEELVSNTNLNIAEREGQVWFRVTAVDITGNESRPSEPVRLIVPE